MSIEWLCITANVGRIFLAPPWRSTGPSFMGSLARLGARAEGSSRIGRSLYQEEEVEREIPVLVQSGGGERVEFKSTVQ